MNATDALPIPPGPSAGGPTTPRTAPADASPGGRSIAALVTGIIGLIACQLISPVAWVLGWQELRDIRAGRAAASGEGMAMAGMVLGIIGSAILGLVAMVALIVVMLIVLAIVAALVAAA